MQEPVEVGRELAGFFCARCGEIGLIAILMSALTHAQGTPRRHIDATRELCGGAKCMVMYEAEEHLNEPCYVSLWCNATAPCTITQTLLAGWHDPMVTKYIIPPNGFIGWEGVYPGVFRVYVGGGRLPWKIEAEGVRAWEAWETTGEWIHQPDLYAWPVKHLLKPASVEVMP